MNTDAADDGVVHGRVQPAARLHAGDRHRQAAGRRRLARPQGGDRPGRRHHRREDGRRPSAWPLAKGARVVVQGFGNVGSHAAEFLASAARRSSASATSHGGKYNPGGHRPRRGPASSRPRPGTIRDLKGATSRAPTRSCWRADCDVLVPAALGRVLTGDNAGRGQGDAGRRGGQRADDLRGRRRSSASRGVTVVPDILANAGGVTVSYFEWVQNLQQMAWPRAEVRAKLGRAAGRGVRGDVGGGGRAPARRRARRRSSWPSAASPRRPSCAATRGRAHDRSHPARPHRPGPLGLPGPRASASSASRPPGAPCPSCRRRRFCCWPAAASPARRRP